MRFQSNASFSKLAPTFVADPFGACTGFFHTTAANTAENILAAPASGFYYELRNIVLQAATTAASATQSIRLQDAPVGNYIVGSAAQAAGTWVNWVGVLPIIAGLAAVNTTPNTMGISIFYRTIPIPS